MTEACLANFQPCFSNCIDGEYSTGYCWRYIFSQVFLSLSLILIQLVRGRCNKRQPRKSDDDTSIVSCSSLALHNQHDHNESSLNSVNDLDNDNVTHSPPIYVRKKRTRKLSTRNPILKTSRSEINFMKSNIDEDIQFPSSYQAEYVPIRLDLELSLMQFVKAILKKIASDDLVQNRVMTSASLSLLSSSVSSILAMMFKHERWTQDCMENLGLEYFLEMKEWIIGHTKPFSGAIDAFKFLPIFLLLAHTGFLVDRWRSFMVSCHTIQGRIQDIGILLGSVPDKPVSKEDKKQLYKIYRLLNVIHIACYKIFLKEREFMGNDDSTLSHHIVMGLLTEEEYKIYGSMGKKMRDGLCSTLLCEIDDLLCHSKKKFTESKAKVLNEKVCQLRQNMAKLHDLFVRDNPKEYVLAMQFLVHCYVILIVTGYPLLMFSDTAADFGCIQPLAFIGTFFTLLSLQIPFILFIELENPFDAKDDIKAENLIASTELALFHSMRCQFNDVSKGKCDGNG